MKKIILLIGFCFVVSNVNAEQVRVVYRSDKSIAIISPSKGGDYNIKVLDCMKSNGLEGMEYEDMDSSLLPSRENRNAWEGKKGKEIKVNPAKIKPIAKTLEERIKDLELKAK